MRREVAQDVPAGRVVRFKGEWGVMGKWVAGYYRIFDRWDAPPIMLKLFEAVEVPSDPIGKK